MVRMHWEVRVPAEGSVVSSMGPEVHHIVMMMSISLSLQSGISFFASGSVLLRESQPQNSANKREKESKLQANFYEKFIIFAL